MTTVELAQRLIGKSKISSLDKADSNELLVLADCINQAIQEYFAIVPEAYRITTLSSTHDAPATITANFTNGSNVVSGDPFLDAQRGDTVAIAGDELKYNEITDNGLLLNDFRGATGSHVATVYDDAIALTDFSIERMVSHPRIIDNNTQLTNGKQYRSTSGSGSSSLGNRSIGNYPNTYHVDYVGASRVTDALVIIRFNPLPTRAFTVNLEVSVRPIAYDWTNILNSPRNLPVDDSVIHRTLRPMALARLAETDLWKASESKAAAITAGQRAERHAASLSDSIDKPDRKVRTRKNF